MRASLVIGIACLFAMVLVACADSVNAEVRVERRAAEKRVAVVVGNSAYTVVSPLKTPVNDARAMSKKLENVGFEVILVENATRARMFNAIIEFGDRIKGGGVGLFFFSGHGLQAQGRNYLVPVDADVRHEADIESETIDIDRVLQQMALAGNRLNIVILDACQNNPFGSRSGGLAPINAPAGTMIALAAAPGKSALDDADGIHGVYTSELLKAIGEPGLTLDDVFRRVIKAVREKTHGKQVPWYSTSIQDDFWFTQSTVRVLPPPHRPAADDAGLIAERQSVDNERRRLEDERRKLVAEQHEIEKQRRDLAARKESDARKALIVNVGTYHALVIGNQNYRHIPTLKTPIADAIGVRETLEREYGFKVTLLRNATRDDILGALYAVIHGAGHDGGDFLFVRRQKP